MEKFRVEVNRDNMSLNELRLLLDSLADAVGGLAIKDETYRISLLITLDDDEGSG